MEEGRDAWTASHACNRRYCCQEAVDREDVKGEDKGRC
jgi:hypothetical protein